jgi:hypothetical protein
MQRGDITLATGQHDMKNNDSSPPSNNSATGVAAIDQLPLWPYSTVPDSLEWSGRCYDQLMLRDASLDRSEALQLAAEMGTENWCRLMQPEAAVDALFQTGDVDELAP